MNTLHSAKFLLLLSHWGPKTLNAFAQWLQSPWCNRNKNLIRLLQELKKYHPHFDHPKLNKERLFKQILPKGSFSTRRMNNLLSEAYLAAERFLTFQELSQDENLQQKLLCRALKNHHLDQWYFKKTHQAVHHLEQKPVKDWEDHLALLEHHRQLYHHPDQSAKLQPGNTTIVRMNEELDLVYLLEKAAIINEMISRNRMLKNENHPVESEMEKWFKAVEGIRHPTIEFYQMRFQYSEVRQLEQYFELRDAFIERYEELNEKEQKIHLVSLLNDTALLIRARELDITANLPLYQLGLKTGIILHQGKLSYTTYLMIVSASNTKNDFQYTQEFIHQYTPMLDSQYQDDALQWAKAHTAYYQNQYTQCLDILLAKDFKIYYFRLITKVLTTQVYFDLYLQDNSYQLYLFNYFDSFEKWLLREKFESKFTKKSYLRFVQVGRSLAKSYESVNFKIEKVNALLEGERNIQAFTWLKQKKEEILALKSAK